MCVAGTCGFHARVESLVRALTQRTLRTINASRLREPGDRPRHPVRRPMRTSRTATVVVLALALFALFLSAGATDAKTKRSPSNRGLPHVAGAPVVGRTLNASRGKWSNRPTRYRFNWLTCNAAGNRCRKISNARSRKYRVAPRDVGLRIRVVVRASNEWGHSDASSRATRAVIPGPRRMPPPAPPAPPAPPRVLPPSPRPPPPPPPRRSRIRI